MIGRFARRAWWVAAVAGVALAAASCGGDDEPEPPKRLIVYEAQGLTSASSDYMPAGSQAAAPAAQQVDATNVYTIDAETGATTQLTRDTGFTGHPGWSPDYSRVIFISDRESTPRAFEVYTMAPDGTDVRRITNTTEPEWTPKFSPDGSTITYISIQPDGSYLGLMEADGSNPRRVAGPYEFAEFPAWTRDGKQVYFSAVEQDRNDADIYSYDIETEDVLTRISTPAADVCPHFTHDRETLTYATVAPSEEGNIDLYAHDMSSDDTTGASDTRLTDHPEVDDYGNPSPDDKSMVYISRRDGESELYLMDRNGENERPLSNTPGLRENVPDW